MSSAEQRLADCLRLLEESGDVAHCIEVYPELRSQVIAWAEAMAAMRLIDVPEPRARAAMLSRQAVLSTLQTRTGGQRMLHNVPGKAAAALAALTLALVGVVGAGAAGSPGRHVLSSLGVVSSVPVTSTDEPTDNHGTNVSGAVHDAQATATPGAGGVGAIACQAAHDRSTLPPGAQNAQGQEGDNDNDKDCSDIGQGHAAPASPGVIEAPSGAIADASPTSTPTPNHGQSVSNAVHDAQASSTPGPGRGQAVSEAACTAAHDRSTLPQGAQNANANTGKDCTHPNSANTTGTGNTQTLNPLQPVPSSGQAGQGNNGQGQNGNGRGPQNAPVIIPQIQPQSQGGSNGRPAGVPPGPPNGQGPKH